MRNTFLALLLCLLLTAAGPVYADSRQPAPAFQVNGTPVSFDASTGAPYISGGRTMMPLRVCLDAAGCVVDWDQQTRTVTVRKGAAAVVIPIGGEQIFVNGRAVSIDAPAVIENGRTYLPLRAVLEAGGSAVDWDAAAKTVVATELTPANINGGTTGIFRRQQLAFAGFDGIQAQVTLPRVALADKGDCPYVYFGFDWQDDTGNAEGGFQFIEDPAHPCYNKWTVFLRQGSEWRWSEEPVMLEQGSSHHLKFYSQQTEGGADLVIALDGVEVIRKPAARADFKAASAKAVISMAMLRTFDGSNCHSASRGAKFCELQVSAVSSESYVPMETYPLYSNWQPQTGPAGMWYGTVDCIPSYLHSEADGSLSIYKEL